MEATRSSCSESALDVCKSPEKMSKTFAKKVSKMGGKGYREKERARFWEAVFGKKFFKNAGFKPFVDSRKSFLGTIKSVLGRFLGKKKGGLLECLRRITKEDARR